MFDVVAVGELLIDFTPAGYADDGYLLLKENPGGAPANVLVALARLGGKSALIGKVGNDQFGYFLRDTLDRNGVCTSGIKFCDSVKTTLAFVHLDEMGDRSFEFYRNPGADTMLEVEDIDLELIKSTKIFHFGSLSMTNEPSRSATMRALEYAKENNKIISYDPNWRPLLWESDDHAKEGMKLGLAFADILKVSFEEMELLTGESDLLKGSKMLREYGAKLVIVTLGEGGAYYLHPNGSGHINTYKTSIADTTGAGDAFVGCLLYNICKYDYSLENLKKHEIEEIINMANAAGALCASAKGAIPSMPTMERIKHCITNMPKLIY